MTWSLGSRMDKLCSAARYGELAVWGWVVYIAPTVLFQWVWIPWGITEMTSNVNQQNQISSLISVGFRRAYADRRQLWEPKESTLVHQLHRIARARARDFGTYDAHRTDRAADGQAFLSPGSLEYWIRGGSSRMCVLEGWGGQPTGWQRRLRIWAPKMLIRT